MKDLVSLLKDADTMTISSEAKVGKMTFSLYLLKMLFNEKALIFSSQESYLFNKKLTSLSKQFDMFKDIENDITRYSLTEEWTSLKRLHGYDFLLTEIERIISKSEEKVIFFHRLGDFFEFQDRHNIEHFYKSLVKIVASCGKKLVFIINNQNQNYKFIQEVSEEYSDVNITISKNEKNERLLEVKNILTHEEYPLMKFFFHDDTFTLKYLYDKKDEKKDRTKNILLMELVEDFSTLQVKMLDVYNYIFNRKEFNLHHADSLQSALHSIFIEPDMIIVLMSRDVENFEMMRAIKKQLPDTIIIAVINQDFVRTEDVQMAYDYGCDELFPRTYLFDKFILSVQKTMNFPFYSETLNRLPKYDNIVESKSILKELSLFCIDNAIFFTIFTIKNIKNLDNLKVTMRHLDYIYIDDDNKIYYLALNTMPVNVSIILEKQYEKFGEKLELLSTCTPFNLEMLEECL